GNIVCAKIRLLQEEEERDFTKRLKQYCLKRLKNYKVPVKVRVIDEKQYSDRFKKRRVSKEV
ncbi:long-chain fatty acid--CoA ligase, partial [bacterium]